MRENGSTRDDGASIDFQELMFTYLRYWWFLAICAVVAAAAVLFYSVNFIVPRYRASVTVYVNNAKETHSTELITNINLAVSQRLVGTYIKIIDSDSVLETVAEAVEEETGVPFTASAIRGMMTAEQVEETELFKVHISNKDPEMAAIIANGIATVAPGKISEYVVGSSTKIVDYAKVPTTRYTPSHRNNAMLGAVAGFALALIYLTIRYLMDVRINDSDDLEQLFEYAVLGQVPNFNVAGKGRKYGYRKYGYRKYGYGRYGYSKYAYEKSAYASGNQEGEGGVS